MVKLAGSADVSTCVCIGICHLLCYSTEKEGKTVSLEKHSEDLFFIVLVLLFSYVNYAFVPENHKILFPCYYPYESFNKIMYGSDTSVTMGLCCTLVSLKLFFLP